MDMGENLKELNMTADEVSRFAKAFKDEKFRELFRDFAQEISDPVNKKKYEEEIKLLEQQRGNNVEFLHPEAFRALRTSVGGKTKCYINICANERVAKPALKSAVSADGRKGQSWSLPHNVVPARQDTDPKGNKITIYDVIFHPDTLHIAKSSVRFMEIVDSTAVEAIQDAFKVTLDRTNVREIKAKYKGMPHPYVIREPIPGFKASDPSERPDPLAFPYPDEKRPKTSQKTTRNSKCVQLLNTKEPTKPNYTVTYRSVIDLQDFRCSRDSARSPRPRAIVVTIDVPLLESAADTDLEVKEKSLLLESRKPDYRLELPLAYPVDEDKGEAKFDRRRGQLIVTLPVLPSNETFEFTVGTRGEKVEEEEEEDDLLKSEDEMRWKQQIDVQKSNEIHESRAEEEKPEETKTEESKVEERKEAGKPKQKQEELDEDEFHSKLREDGGFQPDKSDQHEQIQEKTKESVDGSMEVETDAPFPNQTPSEESPPADVIPTPATPHYSLLNSREDCSVPEGDEESSEKPVADETNGSEEQSLGSEPGEEETDDDDDLPTEQIQSTETYKKPPPVLLREIDPDGNETVFSDHSTSAGIIFQNSLMYELD